MKLITGVVLAAVTLIAKADRQDIKLSLTIPDYPLLQAEW
jgi:hypothetical protein